MVGSTALPWKNRCLAQASRLGSLSLHLISTLPKWVSDRLTRCPSLLSLILGPIRVIVLKLFCSFLSFRLELWAEQGTYNLLQVNANRESILPAILITCPG